MPFVVTLVGFRPGIRNDAPWTGARLYESDDPTGPWAQIQDYTLDPVDVDPMNPAVRDFTTTNATIEQGGWYRVQFYDDAGNVQNSEPTLNAPESSGAPATWQIREWSRVEFGALGYPIPAPGQPDSLEPLRQRAVNEFYAATGIDPSTYSTSSTEIKERSLATLIQEAIQRFVEYSAAKGQHELLETAADFDMLQSMSAGNYSETRRSMVQANKNMLHPWPLLHRLLSLIIDLHTGGSSSSADVPGVAYPEYNWDVADYIINARKLDRSKFASETGVPGIFYDTSSVPEVGP